MRFHVLTLFPEMIRQVMGESIIGRAADSGIISVNAVNIRDFSRDKHNKVDDYPYGGGAGMLMQADPVYDAWRAVCSDIASTGTVDTGAVGTGAAGTDDPDTQKKGCGRIRTIYVTPQGRMFTQDLAKELAAERDLIFLCGHYEGIDERVLDEVVTDYVSIGDYVLTGGELPAMVMIDAISRMVPGVLSNDMSGADESFEGELLEYPQYSRPVEWHGVKVPDVLLSGNAAEIKKYRTAEAVARTKERRPDMYENYMRLERIRERLSLDKMLYIDMTELIKRGRARLIYEDEYEVCLKDKYSGAYFYAMDKKRDAALNCAIEAIKADAIKHSNTGKEHFFVLHQIEAVEPFGTKLLAQTFMECRQCVYTRREKVPVKGLYVTDSTRGLDAGSEKPVIRRLGVEYAKAVYDNYDLAESMEYIRERIEKGMIFGAFAKDKLAGFVGYHAEGSIGMLEVLPQFRRRGIGRALEVFIINHCIESGYTPYGNVVVGNEVSERLQESIGLYFSKTNIFWGSFNITGDKT